MKVDIVMPKMGESINEGTLIKWHKKKGEKVQKDEIIFEISTDKVDTEIPSPADGILSEIKVFEQETVDVDTVVAVIDTDGDAANLKKEEKPSDEIPSTSQVGGELVEITMPKMGESVMEGTIIKWHKKVGDKVQFDEILYEISTDKVDTEVPSPVEGTIAEIFHNENDTVDVGTVVAKISTSGGIVKPGKDSSDTIKSGEKLYEPETNASLGTKSSKAVSGSSNRFYSPLVLNIARREDVSFQELERINGTGTGGRVTKKDILEYINNKRSGKPAAQKVIYHKDPIVQPEIFDRESDTKFDKSAVEIIPMDNIRQKIMTHMVNSRDTSVHVTAVLEVDITKIYNFLEAHKEEFFKNENVKLTYMSFVSFAVIKALKEYPYLNASIDGNNIVVKKYINLGIAVAVEPNGLIVPNIKHADEKNIRGLARSINEIGYKARNKGLTPDDITDGTFTITNYGIFGSLFGTPIINQPEVAILGVGSVTKKAVVVEVGGADSIIIKPMMYLSLSHDHRLVDGMLGGRFLKSIKDTLENFDTTII